MIITDIETIVNFLHGDTEDYQGRTYNDIIECDDKKMEQCHDQVQWMFPLHEESNFAMTYPILTPEAVEEAKKSPIILSNLVTAKDRMEKFYGIGEYEDINKQRPWCKEYDHNLLRITRIIRCLRLFGLEDDAQDFYEKALKAAEYFGLSNVTKAYWWRAAKEDVWETLR